MSLLVNQSSRAGHNGEGYRARGVATVKRNDFILLAGLNLALLMASVISGCGSATPSITKVSPPSGANGINVVINGQAFGGKQGRSMVIFGATKAKPRSWSDTSIVVSVPGDLKAGDYRVSVTTDKGTSNYLTFTIETSASTDRPTTATTPTITTGPVQIVAPEDAIASYMQSENENMSNYVLKATKTSLTNPAWKTYDYQRYEGIGHEIFLLQQINGSWTVVTAQTEPFNTNEYGAPSDLNYP